MLPPSINRAQRRQEAFSLVELAIVIALLGLLLGTLTVPLAARFDALKRDDTQRRLQGVTEALIGFAIANGRLPCPDRDRNGVEDRPCADALEGFVPWAQLGVPPTDAWGRLLLYRVAAEFTAAPIRGGLCNPPNGDMTSPDGVLNLCDQGDITVFTRGDDPASSGIEYKSRLALAYVVPAVVVSQGSNGSGGTDLAGHVLAGPTGADERENLLDSNAQFMSRIPSRASDPCNDAVDGLPLCEFDDLVSWVSANVLFHRLVSAGRLP